MIQVALLVTLEQKNELVGQMFDEDSYFNPVQDINNNWVISLEEVDGNIYPQFDWIKTLPIIAWEPKPANPL